MTVICHYYAVAVAKKCKKTLRKIPTAPYLESVKELNADKQLESIDPDVYTFLSVFSSELYEQKCKSSMHMNTFP